MKCLVTGAAGFIGSHLVDRLLKEGHEVVGVDQRHFSIMEKSIWENPFYDHICMDLANLPELPEVEGIDWVFHLAAKTGLQPWPFFDDYLSDNVLSTQRLLEACRRYCPNLKRFVYASTSSVYGKNAVGDETIIKQPVSPYGFTKLGAEGACHIYQEHYGVPVTILRYFSVYGPRQREGMAIRKWIDAALRGEPLQVCKGSLAHTRSLTYVDDVVEATLLAAQKDEAVGQVFNIAGLGCHSMAEVITEIAAWVGYQIDILDRLEPREGDQENTQGYISKAQEFLGWTPTIGLEEGLRQQVEWQRNLMEGGK